MSFLDKVENFFICLNDYINIKKIVIAIIAITLILALRQVFTKIIMKIIRKLTAKTKTDIDDMIIDGLEKPISFIFIIISIWIAAKVMGFALLPNTFMYRLIRSLVAFTLFWAAYGVSDVLAVFFRRVALKSDNEIDDILFSFLKKGIKAAIVILGFMVIMEEWEYDIKGFIAGLGLGGLAFALAAKDTAANFFGSVMIMIDKPFRIGDWIKTPEIEGTVEEIGFRSTRIRTFAQAIVTVPNSIMNTEAITNWSRMGKRRISFKLGVTYNTDADKLNECIKRIRNMLKNHQGVDSETIFVYFEKFGNNALEILLYFFTKTTNWQKFLEEQQDINFKIMKILEKLNIEVAFPSRSIYIEKDVPKKINE